MSKNSNSNKIMNSKNITISLMRKLKKAFNKLLLLKSTKPAPQNSIAITTNNLVWVSTMQVTLRCLRCRCNIRMILKMIYLDVFGILLRSMKLNSLIELVKFVSKQKLANRPFMSLSDKMKKIKWFPLQNQPNMVLEFLRKDFA